MMIGDRSFRVVKEFVYLGSLLTKNKTEKEIQRRITLANGAYFGLNKLRFKYLLIQFKVTLYKTLIRPILAYGVETWTITIASEAQLFSKEKY